MNTKYVDAFAIETVAMYRSPDAHFWIDESTVPFVRISQIKISTQPIMLYGEFFLTP